MKKFGRKRYNVQAKRRNTTEKWTDWTDVDNYREAVNHACHVEELGYAARIVIKDKAVEELRDIFGNSFESAEIADAVLDAGFRKQSEVIREVITEVDKLMKSHASGDIDDKNLHILFEKLKKKYDYSEGNNG